MKTPAALWFCLCWLHFLSPELRAVGASEERITTSNLFEDRLRWVGSTNPSSAETAALLGAMDEAVKMDRSDFHQPFLEFLKRHPASPWTPSVRANLAHHFKESGRYSKALEHWEAAWKSVADHSDRGSKELGDFVLAYWPRLLASLGRENELQEIMGQVGGRRLRRFDWQRSLAEVQQAAESMREEAGVSFRCGTYSLFHVGHLLVATNQHEMRNLLKIPSPRSGFSLSMLEQIARTNGMALRAVRRTKGQTIIVPSVVHWRQNHYAAILERRDAYCLVIDPTFGESKWISAEIINEEASGYFLVPQKNVPDDWSLLESSEAATVFGRGFPNYDFGPPPPPCETCPCPPGGSGAGGGGGGGSPPGCGGWCYSSKVGRGMPVWDVTEPDTSLALYDTPFFYRPARGEEFKLKLSYRQRDSRTYDDQYPGFGPYWSGGWVEFLEINPDAGITDYSSYNATRFVGNGGGGWKYKAASGSGGTAREPRHATKLERLWNGSTLEGFKLTEGSGDERIYKYLFSLSGGRVRAFLTEHIVLPGYTNRYEYALTNSVVIMRWAVDADGRTNHLFYENGSFPLQITKITNSYGNTVTFEYDTSGLLTNITDMVGLASGFIYDTSRITTPEIVRMITPYGTNHFKFTGKAGGDLTGESGMAGVGRSVLITLPNLARHLFAYRDTSQSTTPNLPYSESDYPGNTTGFEMGNIHMWYRNSFYWGPRQYGNLSTTNPGSFTATDYLQARRRNYLHLVSINPVTGAASIFSTNLSGMPSGTHYSTGNMLNMEQEPSPDGATAGQRTWYGYHGKSYFNDEGTNQMPTVVAKILPDGRTNYTFYQYNRMQKPLLEVTTGSSETGVYFRTNRYVYAANEIDLLLKTNASGIREAAYAYNANHQPLFITNAVGDVTAYLYNSDLRVIRIILPTGLTITNIYDGDGRLAKMIDLEISRTNSFTYSKGLVFTHTDERNLTTTNFYDGLQRLTAKLYPDGTYVSNAYSRLNLAATRDRMGDWTSFGYDSVQQQTSVTNARGHVTLYNYCACGALDSTTDALNNTTYFYYDKAGRRVATEFPDLSWTTNRYDRAGRLTNVIDSAGTSVTNWYNVQGMLTTTSNGIGRLYATHYDHQDRVTNSVDANGVVIAMSYDALDRMVRRTHADGGVERFYHQPTGRLLHTNQLDHVTGYAYDVAGRKLRETNANNEIVHFAYNAASDLVSLTDARASVTQWGYDEYGRVTNKIDAANNVIFVYRYDADGRLTNRWTPAKQNTYYGYDAVGNLTVVDYNLSTDLHFAYDAVDRLTNMVDALGTTAFNYTSVGLLAGEDGPWSNDAVSYGYTNQLRSSMTVAGALMVPSWQQSYGYDPGKRPKLLTASEGIYTYNHWRAGHLFTNLALPGGMSISNRFDAVGRTLMSAYRQSGGTMLDSQEYLFSLSGQRTNLLRQSGDRISYLYDPAGQLTRATAKESGGTDRLHEQFGYRYDTAGSLHIKTNGAMEQTFDNNSLNQVTENGTGGDLTVAGMILGTPTSVSVNGNLADLYADHSFARRENWSGGSINAFSATAQDALGRVDTHSITLFLDDAPGYDYDLNGNMVRGGRKHFTYDDENQLTQVVVTNQTKSEFVYDGKKRRRVRKEYAWTGMWHQTLEVRYLYDVNLVVQERHFEGAVPTSFPQRTVTYTRGPDLSGSWQGAGGIGGMLARSEHSTITSSLSTVFYHADMVGNVTSLVGTNQQVAGRYLYEPFGRLIAMNGPLAEANTYRFSSKEVHEPSGLAHYFYRYYEPSLQRWINRDPIEEKGGLNLYGFVKNRPVHSIDPYGLFADDEWPESGPPAPCPAGSQRQTEMHFDSCVLEEFGCIHNPCKPDTRFCAAEVFVAIKVCRTTRNPVACKWAALAAITMCGIKEFWSIAEDLGTAMGRCSTAHGRCNPTRCSP
ncbi:MAG: RHS repeat-associated core domain-containing protein [Patescibacteria group bacterium]